MIRLLIPVGNIHISKNSAVNTRLVGMNKYPHREWENVEGRSGVTWRCGREVQKAVYTTERKKKRKLEKEMMTGNKDILTDYKFPGSHTHARRAYIKVDRCRLPLDRAF